MSFDFEKKMCMGKKDKSAIGSIDAPIKPLCDLINSKGDYYTTSSCAGRIILIRIPDSGKKNESEWLFVSHDKATLEAVSSALKEIPQEEVWFRFEPFIIHVAARTEGDASKLLKLARDLGLKRAGIISLGDRFVLEIIGIEQIDTIVSKDGKLLVTEEYLSVLVRKANRKMERNLEHMKNLHDGIENL